MLSNPDTALPLYLLVVISGILLGSAWHGFIAAITTTGTTVETTTAGSAAMTGGTHQ